jgi:hypothetical protein
MHGETLKFIKIMMFRCLPMHNVDAQLCENRSSDLQDDTRDTSTDGDLLNPFSSAFAKLRKAIITFVMSVRMGQVDSHWKNFH